MSEEPEVITGLVRSLAADVEYVGEGHFSLDLARARDKLATQRLADPAELISLLVEAGNLVDGCTQIRPLIAGVAKRIALRSRVDELKRRGIAGVATIKSVEAQPGIGEVERQEFSLEVALPDQRPYHGRVEAPMSADQLRELAPGTRVYVRVDPDDDQRIVFDR